MLDETAYWFVDWEGDSQIVATEDENGMVSVVAYVPDFETAQHIRRLHNQTRNDAALTASAKASQRRGRKGEIIRLYVPCRKTRR